MVNASDFGILSNTYKFRTMVKVLFFRVLNTLGGKFLSKMLRLLSKIVHDLEGKCKG
jgi:hypothetical protein